MAKALKFWNGRPHGKYANREKYIKARLSVAAYSVAQAVEILNLACECPYVSRNEINTYYSPCWGSDMLEDVVPTEPCVYVVYRDNKNTKYIREQIYPVKSKAKQH